MKRNYDFQEELSSGPFFFTKFIGSCEIFVVVQFYSWFKFYFLLFQTCYHTLTYRKTKPGIKKTKHIRLFRERLSEKVHATIPKGLVGGFKFTVL